MPSVQNNPMDRLSVIFSGVIISALGAMFYNTLPLFLGSTEEFRELSDRAAGVLASAFFAGFTLTTSTAYFWIRRSNWRIVTLISVPLAAAAMILAGYAGNYALIVCGIFIAGCAFSALYGIGTTALGDSSNPARWYGLKIAGEAGMGMILLLILPDVAISRWGFEGMMAAMALTLLLFAPLLIWMPKSGIKGNYRREVQAVPLKPGLLMAIWMGLAGVLIFLFSTTMTWAFVERLANEAGIDPIATGNVLSLALVFAIGGSLLAMFMGNRFGAGRPFAVACLSLLVSLFLLAGFDELFDFGLAVCVFTFAFGLGIPYVVAIVADLDMDGRFVVLTVPAIGIGVMVAPAIGGIFAGPIGYDTILWASGIAVLLAMIISLGALHRGLPLVRSNSC